MLFYYPTVLGDGQWDTSTWDNTERGEDGYVRAAVKMEFGARGEIVMRFSEEKEFRFAFAKDGTAFDVNNVDYFLTDNVPPANVSSKGKKLILGDLSDIVKIVR